MVGVLAIQIFLYPGRRYVASPNEIYENYCMQELEGEIGKKQEQWLMKEQDRLNCAEERDLFQLEREVMENKILPLSEHLKSMKQEKEKLVLFSRQDMRNYLEQTIIKQIGKIRCSM